MVRRLKGRISISGFLGHEAISLSQPQLQWDLGLMRKAGMLCGSQVSGKTAEGLGRVTYRSQTTAGPHLHRKWQAVYRKSLSLHQSPG